jgi:hypothetical protein
MLTSLLADYLLHIAYELLLWYFLVSMHRKTIPSFMVILSGMYHVVMRSLALAISIFVWWRRDELMSVGPYYEDVAQWMMNSLGIKRNKTDVLGKKVSDDKSPEWCRLQ